MALTLFLGAPEFDVSRITNECDHYWMVYIKNRLIVLMETESLISIDISNDQARVKL